MRPTIIFDKSLLQSLNADEACLLDNFFSTNITPLFFVETLADIEKSDKGRKSPEAIVRSLAYKTPSIHSYHNLYHGYLVNMNLLGYDIDMKGVPIVSAGKVTNVAGKQGVFRDLEPQSDALERWHRGEFIAIERLFARGWRDALSRIDLRELAKNTKQFRGGRTIKTPSDAWNCASEVISITDGTFRQVQLTCSWFQLGQPESQMIAHRWQYEGRPPLREFAPYAYHVLAVDLFFALSLGTSISTDRPSNKIDSQYLYYIPFCHVFSSFDKLHIMAAPFFLRQDQQFIGGSTMKDALRQLDQHYSNLPDQIKESGLINFADMPPMSGHFIMADIWDRACPGWRNRHHENLASRHDLDGLGRDLSSMLEAAKQSAKPGYIDDSAADHVFMERRVCPKVGKWWKVPKGSVP